jgi:glyoxylase-like metal-dependent hydrolase (beta-lactamase superfamily II)
LTHGHADHAGGATDLALAAGVPIVAHRNEADVLIGGKGIRYLQPKPDLLSQMLFQHFVTNGPPTIKAIQPDQLIDVDVLPLLGGVQCVPLPGHSAGQVCQ